MAVTRSLRTAQVRRSRSWGAMCRVLYRLPSLGQWVPIATLHAILASRRMAMAVRVAAVG